jgi:acetyl-CoA carboxylase carboxyl transferase subunit beta
VIVVLDFSFMGGSMGCVVGEKVALAFELAVKKKLPVVAVVSSGGARMQEGMLSLMQMAKTAAAAKRLHVARLPFISVLTNPTTGEVYASFANLGDVIVAEPHALVGLASLRTVEEATGGPLPEGSHTAEFQLEHGMIDLVVDRNKLRELLSILLYLLSSRYRLTLTKKRLPYQEPGQPLKSAWEEVQLARHEKRPTALDYITRITSGFVELHGDRLYGDDKSIVCGLAELSGQAVVIIGQERDRGGERIYPEGFRKAQRAMRLAAKFDLPVITLIDTPGAYPGLEAEERGVGEAIASTMALMSDLPAPIVSTIIGEGGSEGALAMGVADRILMLENAIYSVISPEGAASIIYRDATKAEELAPALKLTARDCKELEVVDVIVPEPEGGAHRDPEEAARQLKIFLVRELLEIQRLSLSKLLKARYKKFRRMGEYSSYYRTAISREVSQLQDYLQRGAEELREHIPGKGKGSVPLEKENNTLVP